MSDPMPHVLVVDDDARLRELLRRYLAANDFRVTTAADAADARARLQAIAFDLVVLDVMMPGEDGLSLTVWLQARGCGTPVLLLTAMGEAADRIAGLERGAEDYLAKPFEPRELVLRMRSILRRRGDRPPVPQVRAVSFGTMRFDVARGELSGGAAPPRLTTAETGLLRALAVNAGRALSRDELRRAGGISGGERTVDVQVTRLRRKIEPDPGSPRYLQTVWGRGYVLKPDGVEEA